MLISASPARHPTPWLRRAGLALGLAAWAGTALLRAEELQRLEGVVLLGHAGNDGDSFRVQAGDRELTLRLYFADCCETTATTETDARRVRQQMRYFGLADAPRTLAFGNQAKEFTARALERPFTVHTAYARALGRSAIPRIYAFVTTAAGQDLATLLVQGGLARAFGVGRATAAGVPRDEQAERLRDVEAAAMLKRLGVWSESNPERLAELRAQERQEERELQSFIEGPPAPAGGTAGSGALNANTASREQLAAVPGLRPEWVDAILAERPFARLEDLLRIKGIGPKTLEKLRGYLVIDGAP